MEGYEGARTRLALAEALVSLDTELAATEARTAMGVFEVLGATLDADATAALLRGLGTRVPRAVGAPTDPLSPRDTTESPLGSRSPPRPGAAR